MIKLYKYILFVFLLGLIFLPQYYLPYAQDKGQILQAETLQGAYEQTKRPNFWAKKWLEGDFQKGYESYVRDRNPITPFAVRLNTQIDFTLFNTIPHHNILAGKHGEFYTKTDCEAYIGLDFKGQDWIEEKVRKLKYLIEYYKEKNIHFVALIPAGKPGLYPENMPDYYQNFPIDSTNRKAFLDVFSKNDIPYLDFNFLLENKKNTQAALIGEASLHWSRTAYLQTADSLRSFLINNYDLELPEIIYKEQSDLATSFSKTDKEMVNGANFLIEPELRAMPHPEVIFQSDSTLQKFRILSVGDSYYLSFYKNGIHEGLFYPQSKFLYYNHEVFPEANDNGKRVYAHDLDILSEIERSKVVLITVYETNLKRFGFNFIDKVYELISKEKDQIEE